MGDEPREVDVRLFTTLVRFDAAYHGHFKTNRNKLTEMPNLWRYARELYALPGWGEHGRLRPHQAALLRHPPPDQPDRDRAQGSRPGRSGPRPRLPSTG